MLWLPVEGCVFEAWLGESQLCAPSLDGDPQATEQMQMISAETSTMTF